MTTPILGIDFGTCRTSAAVVIGGKLQPLVFGKSRSSDFPTAVLWERRGKVLVGEEAIQGAQRGTGALFQEFKLKVGRREPIEVDGETLTYTDLVASVLERVRLTAEKEYSNGQPITTACITVPALYSEGGDSWHAMEEAARAAGFQDVQLLREPQAAALYYDWLLRQERDGSNDGKITLVYDLGGGTFDPAVILRQANNYEIKGGQDGDGVRCGGVLFDECIREDFRRKCPGILEGLASNPMGTESPAQRRNRYRDTLNLREFLLDAKIRLSESGIDEFREEEPLEGKIFHLKRSEFESMISGYLDQTLDACDRIIQQAGVSWDQIDRILMVGGSCYIPLVRRKLDAHTKSQRASLDICWRTIGTTGKVYDPLLAVAFGAALEGAGDVDFQQGMLALEGKRTDQKDQRAFDSFRRAAQSGHAEANMRLAELLDAGRGCGPDAAAAFECVTQAAKSGLARAQSDLGLRFHLGLGTPSNFDEARKWLRVALENGDELAKSRLQELEEDNPEGWFAKGESARKGAEVCSSSEGLDWYRKAAEAGHIPSQLALGKSLAHTASSNGAKAKEGFQWLERAAHGGNVQAQYQVAVCLNEGIGCQQNHELALVAMRKASRSGSEQASKELRDWALRRRKQFIDSAKVQLGTFSRRVLPFVLVLFALGAFIVWFKSWQPGSMHEKFPHVIAGTKRGHWEPLPGYSFLRDGGEGDDLSVAWKPGLEHSGYPHIKSASTEGRWNPDPGYDLVDSVHVRWVPGKSYAEYPHIVSAGNEGDWMLDPGYEFYSGGGLRVRWASGKSHPRYPHVHSTSSESLWEPDPGYARLRKNDLLVRWVPKSTHPQYPHIYASEQEGSWIAEPGYDFNEGGLSVRWIAGRTHSQFPHAISSNQEGKWVTEPGYEFVSDNSQRTRWVSGATHPQYRHIVSSTREGSWTADPGYKFVNGLETRWNPGEEHPKYMHIHAAEEEGRWSPDRGYEFSENGSLETNPTAEKVMGDALRSMLREQIRQNLNYINNR